MVEIGDIGKEHLDKEVDTFGIIRSLSDVRPRLIKGVFSCSSCGDTSTVKQKQPARGNEGPITCDSCGFEGDGSGLVMDSSTFEDYQEGVVTDVKGEVFLPLILGGAFAGEVLPGECVKLRGTVKESVLRGDDEDPGRLYLEITDVFPDQREPVSPVLDTGDPLLSTAFEHAGEGKHVLLVYGERESIPLDDLRQLARSSDSARYIGPDTRDVLGMVVKREGITGEHFFLETGPVLFGRPRICVFEGLDLMTPGTQLQVSSMMRDGYVHLAKGPVNAKLPNSGAMIAVTTVDGLRGMAEDVISSFDIRLGVE